MLSICKSYPTLSRFTTNMTESVSKLISILSYVWTTHIKWTGNIKNAKLKDERNLHNT